LVIGGEWAVALQDDLLFIAPYLTVDMPKKFKEVCRILKVPGKIRPYLFKAHIDPSGLSFQSELSL
jgi:tRNA(Ile)-lysidine synthase